MRALLLLLAVVVVISGCAFSPISQNSPYPIFPRPDSDSSVLSDNEKKMFEPTTTNLMNATQQLRWQRNYYQNIADRLQTGIYNQSDWTVGGATIGTIGGLLKSVPTAAIGALVGGGAGLIGSRYSLPQQETFYVTAAKKTMCIINVLAGYEMEKTLPDTSDISNWDEFDQPVINQVNIGSTDILAELRISLETLTPSAADPQQIVSLFQQFRNQSDQKQEVQHNVMRYKNMAKQNNRGNYSVQDFTAKILDEQRTQATLKASTTQTGIATCVKTGSPPTANTGKSTANTGN